MTLQGTCIFGRVSSVYLFREELLRQNVLCSRSQLPFCILRFCNNYEYSQLYKFRNTSKRSFIRAYCLITVQIRRVVYSLIIKSPSKHNLGYLFYIYISSDIYIYHYTWWQSAICFDYSCCRLQAVCYEETMYAVHLYVHTETRNVSSTRKVNSLHIFLVTHGLKMIA
jgi:hypothetical protein